ncbi:MAG: accessory factor UbiK family protein, partial [Luminiphilus sp.]
LQMFDGVLAAMADHGKDDQGSDKGTGGPGELFERLLGANNPVLGQLDKNARALAQSALAKLDVVPRAEFDAQAAVLQRTRLRVETLEAELTKLTAQLDAIERHQGGD